MYTSINKIFIDDQLLLICVDFLFPSLSALSVQLSFLCRLLMYQPQTAKRIQNEIDNVVGKGKLPELNDRIQ